MADGTVVINGKEIPVAKMRCKHLRRISQILEQAKSEPPKSGFAQLEQWFPFLAESIQRENPDFKAEELDEMTLVEFDTAWAKLVEISGFKIVHQGETKPAELIGKTSTAESAAPSAGPTVM